MLRARPGSSPPLLPLRPPGVRELARVAFVALVFLAAPTAGDIGSCNQTADGLDPNKFFPWIQNLVAQEGPKLLRSKGILAFKDDPDRFAFQGVHIMIEGDHQRPWRETEKRQSRLVFIGRDLPESMIREGFESCVA